MFVYTAYLDESGTHDGSPITVMGGVLARAEQWRDFEKKFTAVQSQYGFRVWHTKKFKKKAGDFRGWTDEKCRSLSFWGLRRCWLTAATWMRCHASQPIMAGWTRVVSSPLPETSLLARSWNKAERERYFVFGDPDNG
jgi:hypothetical protein